VARLDEELLAVGFYLSGHPLEDMAGLLRRHRITLYLDAVTETAAGAEAFRMAGVVRRRQERTSANNSGGKFAFVTLSDPSGEYEVLFPPDTLRTCRDLLEPGRAVMIRVRARSSDGEVRFFGDDARPLDKVIEHSAAGLRIHLSPAVAELDVIRSRLERSDGGGEVTVVAAFPGGREVELKLPGRYRLDPAIRGAIKVAPGVAALEDV
ncbi:MAG TPA: OB-fold nucleic acid binding domain-containing protein, partial [Caulobacteraceae bacterium]